MSPSRGGAGASGGSRGGARGGAPDGSRDGARRQGRTGGGPAPSGQRIVGGLHPVREVLRAHADVRRVLVADGRSDSDVLASILVLAREAGLTVESVDRARLDDLVPGLVHQGVVAIADAPADVALEDLVARARDAGEEPLLVALDGVTDPHNLGSIARTADAVGAHGLILPGRRSATVTPTVEKAAAGALAHLPVATVTNLVRAIEGLKGLGVWSLGLDARADTVLSEHPLAGEAVVLVVGAEGSGLSRLTRERCDALVRLPMRGHVGSLNASVAAAIALYGLRAARDDPGPHQDGR